MEAAAKLINILLLPMSGMQVLLPQSSVAEVADRPEVTPVNGAAPWLQGVFRWRSEQVPLISFESMSGSRTNAASPAGDRQRIAVLHGLEDIPGLVFYAMEIQAIPHPVSLERRMIEADQSEPSSSAVIASNAMIGTQKVYIPDLRRIESLIQDELQKL